MGIFNNIVDSFNKSDFSVSGNKKLKTISKEFKNCFELSLIFYKGNMIADGDLTLAKLNSKTTLKVKTTSDDELIIKANMKVKEVEKIFKSTFGTKVQVKDSTGKYLVDDNSTLGDARRAEK